MLTNDKLLDIALREAVAARTNSVRELPRAGKIRFGVPGVEGLTAVGFSVPLYRSVDYDIPPCVYILTSYEFPVYVGQTTNLVKRLAAHCAPECYERSSGVRRDGFDGVVCIAVGQEKLLQIEAVLINLFRPVYNSIVPVLQTYKHGRMTWSKI